MSAYTNSYLEAHGLVFSFQPRAGSTSIRRALMKAIGVELEHDRIHADQLHHLNRQAHDELRVVADHAVTLVFVRDPAARLESCYRHFFRNGRPAKKEQSLARQLRMKPNEGSLRTFVERVAETPDEIANKHITSMTWNTPVWDEVFRFEDGYEWDVVRKIAASRGLNLGPLGHHNKSPSYASELDDDMRQIIYQRYRADYEEFGYQP